MTKPTAHCTPERCEYPDVVGLIPGVDVSIDGDVWPGSPYAEHIATCPWHQYAPTESSPLEVPGFGGSL